MINTTGKLKVPSTLFVIFKIIFSCCLLFLLVWPLNNGLREFRTLPDEKYQHLTTPALSRTGSSVPDLVLCTGNLLDRRQYHLEMEVDGNNRLMTERGPCHLVRYTTDRIVRCFDLLHDQNQLTAINLSNSPLLHFVFMGDSRTRQQFYNFVRVIPDYDRIRQPIRISSSFHGDIEISSHILRLRLSFKWRPLINDNVTETIRQWSTSNPTERPHLIFLGMEVHHMMPENGADFQLYQKKFETFVPHLVRLSNVSQVIWLNQYPVVDCRNSINVHKIHIVSEKIENYNKAVRRLSKNSRIRIWDSSNPLAEDYVRACAILKRHETFNVQHRPYMFKDSTYADCNDYIHTGYSALSQATQLLYNDICKEHVMTFESS